MAEIGASRFMASARRLTDYLVGQYDETGLSRLAPDNIQFYYKLPAIFATAGQRPLGLHVLDRIAERFFKAGRFDIDGDPIASPWKAYLAGWLSWGAVLLGRLQTARETMDTVLPLQNAQYGGFMHADASGHILQDTERTSAAAMGLVWTAKTESALAAAKFLSYAWNAQPDIARQIHTYVTLDGEVFPVGGDRNACFRLDDPEARPALFATTIAFLVWLGEVTGREEQFDLAASYAHKVLACTGDAAAMPLATKIGWAVLLLARHRPSTEFSDFCRRCGEAIVARQRADGSIGFDGVSDVPKPVAPVWMIGWGCDALLTLLALGEGI